jgi:inward rectifier potassium channel
LYLDPLENPTILPTGYTQKNGLTQFVLKITLARDEVTSEGHTIRRIYDLQLVRNHTPFFALTWTAMHPIDETSPFYGETPESLAADNAELLVTLTGIDETVAQTIHSRQSYAVREIL